MADSERTVTTQAEVDHAIADKAPLLIVRGGTLLAPLILWGNSHAELRENSHAVLRENSHAVLRENSHAVLRGNSHAVLSRYAVAHQMPHHKGTVAGGGTVIVVPPIRTPQDWCDYYGVTVTDGVALVFKGVNQEYQSPRGTAYIPLLEVEAEDWDGGAVECGEGLHFSPAPALTHEFLPTEWLRDRAVKYVACGVKLEDMAIHPNGAYPHKCKARRCLVLYECDRRGEPVTGDPR